MIKVFIIHGFEGHPNGAWRPWLMNELMKKKIYACALAMPSPNRPICTEWVNELSRHIDQNATDDIYLVGHSLGATTILRYLEQSSSHSVAGAILISGPTTKINNHQLDCFLDSPFDFATIKSNCQRFAVIHGDNDPYVPLDNALYLSEQLKGECLIIPNGQHLNGSAGWLKLPQCLSLLEKMMERVS